MIQWSKRRCHHASSLYQPVPGILSTGRFFQYVPSSVLTARLNEFEAFLKSQKIPYVKKITYLRLVDFVADYKAGLLGSA